MDAISIIIFFRFKEILVISIKKKLILMTYSPHKSKITCCIISFKLIIVRLLTRGTDLLVTCYRIT